jgi:protein O-mannosyl-transferase
MFKSKTTSNRRSSRSQPKTNIFSALPVGILVGIMLIVIAVVLAYIPCLNGRFVLDDDLLLTENSLIRATDGLNRFWLTTEAQEYYPVTYSTLWIEWRLWGMNPAGYHVISVILHIVEALLIWIILRKLSIPGAFFAALIFAVHPVNVESVAWIAQLRNTMAMLFFLLSMLWYLRFIELARLRLAAKHCTAHNPPSTVHCPLSTVHCFSWYWLSLAAFVMAMLGKGSVAVLPVLLLGIVWWLRPLERRDLARISPFFVLAAVLTAVNVWFQTHGAEIVTRNADLTQRLLGAGGVVWFYLYKAILPVDLAFVYQQWHIDIFKPLWWMPLLAVLEVTAALWWYRKTWARPLLFAWGFFCVALAPVMGFTDVGFMQYSLVADHYQHIAIIAVIALAAAFWSLWRQRMQNKSRWAATLAAVAAAGSLALLTFQQSAIYRDPVTLYRTTLVKNPDCWMAHNNLGGTLARAGLRQEALDYYGQALRLRPDYPEAHNNLGSLMSDTGHLPEAIEHYKKAIQLKSDYADAHNNLGNAFTDQGRIQEAIEQFKEALRIKPNYSDAHNNLGVVLVQTGKLSEAIEQFKQAVLFKPDYINPYKNLALVYAILKQPSQAVAAAQNALEIARSQEQAAEATQIENWLNTYRAGAPDAPNPLSPSNSAAPTP